MDIFRELLTQPHHPASTTSDERRIFNSSLFWWLLLSLLFAAVCGSLSLKQAFRGEYVVQDDGRQHVFWMERFLDPELFPHDLIADYYQSIEPPGYSALYRAMAGLGVPPLLLSKLLPILLGLIATTYCFALCMELLPVPAAAFTAAVLLNQALWMGGSLAAATPRAFAYPLLLAFLYHLAHRSLAFSLGTIVLQGLFYPQIVLISAGTLLLRLLHWEKERPRLSRHREDYLFCFGGLLIALLALLPYLLNPSPFGPTITAAEARLLPEFQAGGRASFFLDNPWSFWFTGLRSGIVPPFLFKPEIQWVGLLLPILLPFSSRFPLVKRITPSIALLPQILLASLAMFFAAHLLLFRLYLPSRQTQYTLRIVMALAAGITLILLLDAILRWMEGNPSLLPKLSTLGFTLLLGAMLFLYPATLKEFPRNTYRTGKYPQLYQFFAKQPKGILIASLAEEANNLPMFSHRSILVGREFAIPFHKRYYQQIRQRTTDLIQAQYTPDLRELHDFIARYGVDFWLLDREAFTAKYVASNRYMRKFQEESRRMAGGLDKGMTPALSGFIGLCSVFEDRRFVVLDAQCIAKAAEKDKGRFPSQKTIDKRPIR